MNITQPTPLMEAVMKRISKAMGRNRVLPYTYRIQIEMRMNMLRFTATNGNIFYIESVNIPFDGDDQLLETTTFCVDGDSFINLIKNISTETLELVLGEKDLKIKANGTYTFERIDETFNMPNILPSAEAKAYTFENTDIALLNPVKSGLTSDAVSLSLLGYYLTENYLVTTNAIKMCTVSGLSQKIETPLYLTQQYVDLLHMFDEPNIIISGDENTILASTVTKKLYGVQHPGKKEYPPFKQVLGIENPIKISISAVYLQQVLNRLQIFNEETVFLKIKDTKVYLMADKDGVTQEELVTLDTTDLVDLTNVYSNTSLNELLQAHVGNTVELSLDKKSVLILRSGDIVQALAPIKGDEDNAKK